MSDLIAATETVGRDPVVMALGLLALGIAVTRFLFKKRPIWRAIARAVFLVLLTVVLVNGGIVPYQPLRSSGPPIRDAIVAVSKIAWWLWAAWLVVGLLRSFFIFERRPREGKLVHDLLAGLVYLAAVFAIIAYVFDLPVQGLLATSGVIAIVLGLALQSTLNDVFSGIVLNFSRPFHPGDWIYLEGGTEGRVIEMNWRATHVLTSRRDLSIVPNSMIAKSKIVNMNFPSGIHGVTISVQVDATTPPSIGIEILDHAILNCQLILATPEPSIVVKSINATFTAFEITFFVEELASATEAQNELFDLIFRHLAAAGIHLALPQDQPNRISDNAAALEAKTSSEKLLEQVAIFATLTKEERAGIAAKLKQAFHDKGETLIKPGTVVQSLYIVGTGVLSVMQSAKRSEAEKMRLGPGDHFGEMGLLAGSPSASTITALTAVTMYELTKEDLAPILKARPQVAHELCRVLAQRQAAGRAIAAVELDKAVPTRNVTKWFSERIHELFELHDAQ
jgi:small-conductance mechanosensitive channel